MQARKSIRLPRISLTNRSPFQLRTLERSILADVQLQPPTGCPINRLPPEIFLVVCYHIVLPGGLRDIVTLRESENLGTEYLAHYVRPLLDLAHVCRSWRHAITGDPALWSRINATRMDSRLFNAFIDKAGGTPLALFVPLRLLLGHHQRDASFVPRIRHLQLRCPTPLIPADLLTNVFPLKPELESLSVITSTIAVDPGAFKVALASNQDFDLFGEDMPALHALAMCPVLHRLPAQPLPQLTHLFLSYYYPIVEEQRHTQCDLFHCVLQLLTQAPQLTFLHILDVFFNYSGQELPSRPRIALSSMRSLTVIHTHWKYCYHLLSCLDLPETAHIYLHRMWVHRDELESITHPALPPIAPSSAVTRLKVKASDSSMIAVGDGPPDPTTGRPHGRVMLKYEWGYEAGAWCEHWLTNISTHFPLASLRALHLSINTVAHEEVLLAAALRRAPALTELVLLSHWGRSDRAALVALHRALAPTAPTAAPPCPVLELLGLELRLPVEGEPSWEARLAALDGVVALAAARARAGVPLRRVVVQSLHALVPRVLWSRAFAAGLDAALAALAAQGQVEQPEFRVPPDAAAEGETFGLHVFAGAEGETGWMEEDEAWAERYWRIPDARKPWRGPEFVAARG